LREAQSSNAALDALISSPAVPQGTGLYQAVQERMAKRAELRTMEGRYTPEHPLRQRLAGELRVLEDQTIPMLGRELIASLSSQETQAEQRISSAGGELREIPPRAMAEAGLERQVAIAQDLH